MTNSLKNWFCIILMAIPFFLHGQSTDEEIQLIEKGLTPSVRVMNSPEKKFSISERMEYYKVPGLSIAVIKDGKLHWAQGYGIAQEGINVNENTLFQAGSISKPLAALAALHLYQEGKVDLDTDVNNYLQGWKFPESEFTKEQKLTLRHLLTHTGGTTVHGFPGYSQKDKFPTITEVLEGKGNTDAIKSYATPGENWKYSGGGYTIMEKVVEDVSGMPLEEYMAKHIFPKLDMNNSTYSQPLLEKYHAQASAAYKGDGTVYEGRWHNYPEQAAAGLWTTPTDLAKYCLAMQEIYKGKKGSVLSPQTVKEMLSKHKNDWGLGPSLNGEGDNMKFGHGGKNAGFTNNMAAYIHKGHGVIVMTSADRGGSLISEITRSIANQYGWEDLAQKPKEVELKPLKKSELKKLVGKYLYNEQVPGIGNYYTTISVKGNKLIAHDPQDNTTYSLDHIGEMKFLDIGEEEGLQFEKDKEGNFKSFKWNGRFHFDKIEE
ncbi:MAG: beta-lactamase family protein [Bacteroidia bacterium]|nr:beta-lactamase family protein [Bacteroidia bacterium]